MDFGRQLSRLDSLVCTNGIFTSSFKLQCLSSNVALGLGASYIAEFEEQGVGLQWYNITKSPIYDDNYSIGWVMVMMIVDCFVYFILTWYIEAVLPGEYLDRGNVLFCIVEL